MKTYEILSLLLGAATLLVLWLQLFMIFRTFKADHERRKKQATIDYVNQIRNIYRPIDKKIRNKFGEGRVINTDEIEPDDIADIKECLSTVEHLAAGVNIGIFDLLIIEKISGSYFLNMRERFGPYIKNVRLKKGNPCLYVELEIMCRGIDKIREKRDHKADIKHS